jgi:outer membrane autotransporter protein
MVTAVTVEALGTLNLINFNQSIGSLASPGSVTLGRATLTTGNDNPNTNFFRVISGTGGLNKVGTGIFTLSGANTYSGPTTIEGGTLAAANTLSAASHTIVMSEGTLALQRSSLTLNNGLESAGTVQLGIPGVTAAGTTLTVAGHYVGMNGTLRLNTFLGGDGSASDRLVVNGGAASGSTSLLITNVGGPGAATTANGIMVVNAINGATTAGALTLDNPEVRAGDIDYRLFQGGLNGSDPNDWFLRSTFIENGQEFPIIGPELATYGVVQPIARELGLATLGTLHERFGDSLEGTCAIFSATTCCPTPSGATVTKTEAVPSGGCKPAIWARVIGQSVDNRYQSLADPHATGQIVGFQAGFDLWRGSLIPGHTDTAGVYFAYGNANMDVSGLVTNQAATANVMTHSGAVILNGCSGGAYWTHYGPTGWYVDAVIQGTGYDGSATTQFANLPLNGSGIVTSLEAGYPFPFPWLGPRFVLEPQGQIIWQQVSFQATNDGEGPVGLGTTSGATGRLGLRGKVDVHQRQRNGVAALRAGQRLARLGRRGDHDVRHRPGAFVRAGDAPGVRRRRHR